MDSIRFNFLRKLTCSVLPPSWMFISIVIGPASGQECETKYLLEDHATSAVVALYYISHDRPKVNLLAAVVSPNTKQLIKIRGEGRGQFQAVLSGERTIQSKEVKLCSSNGPSEIVIFEDLDQYHMIVK
jgi:hypothetical protein